MKDTDKIIQEAIEKNMNIKGHEEDIKIYRLLFRELAKEEKGALEFSSSFAEKVAEKIEQKSISTMGYKEYILKTASVLLFFLIALGALLIAKVDLSFLRGFASIKWYLISIILVLVLIDFVDKKFVIKKL